MDKEYVQEGMSREYVIDGRGKTVLIFFTEALGRLEVWSKWSKSKEIPIPCIDSSEVILDIVVLCLIH